MMNCCFVFCVLVATFFQIWSHIVPHTGMENGCGWWRTDASKNKQGYSSLVPLLQTVGLVTEVLSILLLLYRPRNDDLDRIGSRHDCCSFSSRITQLLYKLSGISVGAKVCGCIFFICFLYNDYPEMLGCCGLSFVSTLFSSFALCAWEGGPEKILP